MTAPHPRMAQPAYAGPVPRRPPGARVGPATGLYKPDLFRKLLLGVIVLSLSRIHMHLGIGALRPVLLLTLLALAYAVAQPGKLNTDRLLTQRPAKIMLLFGIWACLSAPFGLSLGASARFILESYSKVLILAFLLVAAIRHVRDLRFFFWAYVIAAGALAYLALFVFEVTQYDGYARLSGLYTFDANDISCIIAAAIPISAALFQTASPRNRIVLGFLLTGYAATVAKSGSRGGFLAIAAVGVALLVWSPGVSAVKRVLLITAGVIGLMFAAPEGYWDQMRTLTNPTQDYNWEDYYGRRKTAERGMGYMMRFPLFGVGIANFPRADGTLSDRAQDFDFIERTGLANRWRAAHNSYVEAGAELGVPGLLLWCALVFGGMFGVRRLRRQLPRAWLSADPERRFAYLATVYLPIAWIGFAVASFFVSFAWIEPAYILAALTAGLYGSARLLQAADSGAGRPELVPNRAPRGPAPKRQPRAPRPPPVAGGSVPQIRP